MARRWLFFAAGIFLIAASSLLASRVQTSGGIRIEDVRFAGANGTMSALLYIPPNATARTPAPGVMAVHGLINSLEFARRGYVVLALDMTGHGYSAPPMKLPTLGGPDGLKFLRSQPFVDKNNIGLEGHSLGGSAILSAAQAYPKDYRALILIGSTTGAPAVGTPSFPSNAAFILGAYDEFTPIMWGTKSFYDPVGKRQVFLAKDVGVSDKLRQTFGTRDPVQPEKLYGAPDAGTARELYLPAVTHPGEHISTAAIGDAADWFQKTLKGGAPKSPGDQIWYWKEFGTGVAFIGFVILLLGTFDLLRWLPVFAALNRPAAPSRERRDRRWWAAFWLSVLIPGLSFLPAMIAAQLLLQPMPFLPQVYTNQVLVWALVTALLLWLLRLVLLREHKSSATPWLPSVLIASATVGVGYLSLLIVDAVFHVDYRFWVLGLKLMSPWQFKAFLIYLVPFAIYFLLTLSALHSDLAVAGDSALKHYATAIVAMAGGIALFLVAEYLPLLLNDHLLVPLDPLHPIIGIQFVPILGLAGLIGTFTYRRTNSHVPGALICTLFVTWYVVAGTATMF
jgi:pimeloyl-ACP methyl ester carboxylesterase